MNVPTLGDSISEGQVEEWKVKVGDMIEAGDTIASIETDKVTVDIAAEFSGIITKIHVANEETAEVGEKFCEIDPDAEEGSIKPTETVKKEVLAEDPAGMDRRLVVKPMSKMRQ